MKKALLFPAIATFLFSATALADDPHEFVPENSAEEVLDTGWDGLMSVGATVNGNSNANVPGQDDGQAWNIGFQLDGMLEYLVGSHEWRNSVGYVAGAARTVQLERFIKSADHFQFESIYFYHLPNPSWLGPFARAQMDTSFFTGNSVRAEPAEYRLDSLAADEDGEITDVYQLTTPFAPLMTRESVGFFAQPITTDPFAIDIRLGVGARQVAADGQSVVSDIDDSGPTDIITIQELESYTQAGLENVIAVTGILENGRVSYSISNELMIPLINDDPEGRDAMELINDEFIAQLSFKLVEWASLDYQFTARSEPQLGLPEPWQLTNNLLLTFTQTLVSARNEE